MKGNFDLKALEEFNKRLDELRSIHPEWQYSEIKHAIDSFLMTDGKEILEALPDEVLRLYNNSGLKDSAVKNFDER